MDSKRGTGWRPGSAAFVLCGDGGLDLYAAESGQGDDVEAVLGGCGSADDVEADGLGGEGLLEFGDGAEGGEDLGGLRGEGGRELGNLWRFARLSAQRRARGWGTRISGGAKGGELFECGGVDAGVLADVEGLKVQAVGADFEQERVEKKLGEPMATVFDQGLAEDREIREEIGRAGVRRERGRRGEWDGGLGDEAEACHDARR